MHSRNVTSGKQLATTANRAVFVRTASAGATLFAMGVRALIQHAFPALPPLGLLRLQPNADAQIVSRDEQLRLLRARGARGDAGAFRAIVHVGPVRLQPLGAVEE